jgi:hypothetical protein
MGDLVELASPQGDTNSFRVIITVSHTFVSWNWALIIPIYISKGLFIISFLFMLEA